MELNLTTERNVHASHISPAVNSYEIVLDCINTLSQDCDSYLALISNKQETLALGQLGQICEKFILFIQILKEIRIEGQNQASKLVFCHKKDFQNLLSLFKALLSTVKSNDQKHTQDLIEYELKDNLKRWKISLIQKALKI